MISSFLDFLFFFFSFCLCLLVGRFLFFFPAYICTIPQFDAVHSELVLSFRPLIQAILSLFVPSDLYYESLTFSSYFLSLHSNSP